MKKFWLILIVALTFFACDEVYYLSGIVDPGFDSAEGADRALLVKNETQVNLVAFHGTVATKNVIGGIRANDTQHYFSKNKKANPNAKVFDTTHDFALVLVAHEDYKTYLTDLSKAPIFTTIYVTYNSDSEPNYAYEISKRLGGAGTLLINNMTPMSAELRLDGIHGASLGFVPPNQKNTKLNLGTGDFELYVVFRQYSPKLKETITYYPTDKQGDPRFFTFQMENKEVVLDVGQEFYNIADITFSLDYAYLTVNNGFLNGIEMRNGTSIMYQTNGYKLINSGSYFSFQLEMPNAGGEAADTTTLSALKAVAGTKEVKIPSIEVKKGYRYSINIINNDDKLDYEKDEDGNIKISETLIDLGDIFQE